MPISACIVDLGEALDRLVDEVDGAGKDADKWGRALLAVDEKTEEAADTVKQIRRGRGNDRRPRERRTDAHPEVHLELQRNGAYRITVDRGAQLEPDAKVLERATTKAHSLLRTSNKPVERIVVGRAISNIANAIMRSYVGSSLPTNSQFEYSTEFTKSKMIPPADQLQKCPRPFRNAMARALKDEEVARALGKLSDKNQFEAVHQAITNGYKSFTTHKSRRKQKLQANKKLQEAKNKKANGM